jgi:hypothetical protein
MKMKDLYKSILDLDSEMCTGPDFTTLVETGPHTIRKVVELLKPVICEIWT